MEKSVWRTRARELLSGVVPERPYGKNIEKAVFAWCLEEYKKRFPPPAPKTTGERYISPAEMLSWDNSQFCKFYWTKICHLLAELKRDKELKVTVSMSVKDGGVSLELKYVPQLQYRLMYSKEIKSVDLPGFTAEQLWPNGPIAQSAYKLKTRDLMREEAKKNEEGYEGIFVCRKCKGKKIHYYQMQTRSADEPMTTYFTCMQCGTKWKG
jgi:DNA-directed RNA polymerase subunit M/transcription elongation factor TFIIS